MTDCKYRGPRLYAFTVCERCYCESPNFPTQYPDQGCQHTESPQILATLHRRQLVRVRPFPTRTADNLASRNMWFGLCVRDGRCRGTECTFAHSVAEREVWNTELANRRSPRTLTRERPPPIPPTAHWPYPRYLNSASHQAPPTTANITEGESGPTSRTTWRFKYELRRKNPPKKEDAKLPLTIQTYRRKFHALLYYEEEEHVQVLKDRCDGVYQLILFAKQHCPNWLHGRLYSRYGFLVGMNGDQVMYATQASGIAFLVDPDRHRDVCAAEILGENYRAISEKFYLGFTEEEASKLERYYSIGSEKCDRKASIEFEVKHFYFDLLHDSLNNLTEESLAKLLPTADSLKQQIHLQRIPYPEYRVLKLDKDFQFRALQLTMFSGSSAPILIPGPFGTGKTRLLAVATYDFIKHGKQQRSPVRVLVCCHHQISADTFLERYFGVMQDRKVNPWEDAYLVRVTRENYAKNSKHECHYLPVGEFKRNASKIIKEEYLIVVTTFLTAHSFQRVLRGNVFTHVLIDEGAQAREPETIAPLSMAKCDAKIVIAGDDQQVGPQLLVLGDLAQAHGLSTSLLERLLEHYEKLTSPDINPLSATLRTNYRCVEGILELPSSLFYKSQLIPAARGILPHPKAPYPLMFVCSSLQKVTECVESDTSDIEAQLIINKLVEFLDPWPEEWRYRRLEDVCVMAVSRRQISVLRQILQTDHQWLKRIQLFPTYEMQGREFRALFISTVECVDSSGRTKNPTKSLCNPYVFNTAITRAQSLVVAVGNPFTLLSVEARINEPKYCWREFMSRCWKNNSFIVPSSIQSQDALAEIQSIIEKKTMKVTPSSENDPTCFKTESLSASEGQCRSSAEPQLKQDDLRSIKAQETPPKQFGMKTSVSGVTEMGIQLKPASTTQLGQQKSTTVPLRSQASHTVQQRNLPHGIPHRSVQQAQRTGAKEPAVKQPYVQPPQQSRSVEQQDCSRSILQQKAAERLLPQGAQTSNSKQPQRATIPSSDSAVVARSPNFERLVSSQLGIPATSVKQTQHTRTQKPAVEQDVHLKPQQSGSVDQRVHPSSTPQQKVIERPVQQGAQRTNSKQPQRTTIPSSTSAVVTRSSNFQRVVSSQLGIHVPPTSVKQTQHTRTQKPAVEQDVHLKPQQSGSVEQRDHPSTTPQQKVIERPVRQGAQRANSKQPQHTTIPSNTFAGTTTRSPNFQPVFSSPLGIPPATSVKQTQHTGTLTPAVERDDHLKPQQSGSVEQQDHPSSTPQQKAIKRPVQQGAQRANSKQPQRTTVPSSTAAVITRSPVVSREYDLHFPTLEVAAKTPKQRKQQTSSITNSEQHTPLLRSQFSRHLHDYKAVGNKHNHRPEDIELLKSKLTRDNYREKFHQLLCREEEEHERLLAQRCDGIYTLTIYQPGLKPPELSCEDQIEQCPRYGFITSDDLDGDKIAYAKQASERYMYMKFPHQDSSDMAVKANIVEGYFPKKKGPNVIFVSFSEIDMDKLMIIYPHVRKHEHTVSNVSIVFELKYTYFYRQHDILDRISNEVIAKIVPLSDKEFTQETVFKEDYYPSGRFRNSADLDPFQLRVLKSIMKCVPRAPLLIAGSFGTGKTRLLARAAMQITQEDPQARVLVCAHHQSSVDSFVVNYFSKVDVKMVRLMIPWYSIPLGYEKWYRTAREMKSYAREVQLIVTTLATSLHLNYLKRGHFTHILMDEGAQAREPEAVAPLTLADAKTKIVIAGDHKQVGPSLLVLGEQPQKYGLKVSLLERLHKRYKEIPHTETHCATLLNNYRCQKALLSLPSYLFYDSALVAKADVDAQLHPNDHFPFRFICSNLDDFVTEVETSDNHDELKLLLEEAHEYASKWPGDEWGPKDIRTICIMTATANQKSQVLKMLRSQYKNSALSWGRDKQRVEVLTAYDIQGREFRAVFLSTAEPTTHEGKPVNPTKSPCSQYVFNTAITRSKSLVVCAGNPFLLMKSEKHMDNECQCWRDFIRRCIENKTLHIPPDQSMPPDKLEECLLKLQREVFSTPSDNDMGHAEQDADTIISAYKKVFNEIPQCKKCMVQLKAIGSNSQWEIIPEDEVGEHVSYSDSAPISSDAYKCELVIKSPRTAEAYPIDPSHSVVTINGLKNRHRAFEGDIVWVEVAKRTDDGKCIGKVVGIDQKCHQLKYICKVGHSAILFTPIDKKSPMLVNLPKLSRGLVHNYKKEQINSGMGQDFIVVFDEETLPADEHDPQLPRIKELISADCTKHLLFVVKVLGWLPKYRLPLGAVVDACPRGITYFHAERLLRVAHNISVTDPTFAPEDDSLFPDDKDQGNTELYNNAITIDPPDAKCLDDALSLTSIDDSTCKVAVLIANVAKFLKANSLIDKEAKRRGTSVYGSKERNFMQMLPPSISSKFSLMPGDTRSVICVSARVALVNGSIRTVSDVEVMEAKMCSKARLTYKQAQEILENEQLEWNDTLVNLFKIAMHLRIERLNNAAYSYEISDAGEENNWKAHLLVEELMIWANKSIAKFLYQQLPKMTLLRHQVAPPHDVVAAFQGSFSNVGGYSLAMNHLNFRLPIEPLLVLQTTAKDIRDAISSKNITRLLWLLTCENLYPQLAAAKAQRVLMSHRAEYVCTSMHGPVPVEISEDETGKPHYPPYWHHSLCLSYYTHFTSPIRRYADLIVHRLLQAIFNSSTPNYSPEELSKLCRHLNLRSRAAREFQFTMDKLERAIEFGDCCGEAQAIIIKGEKNTYDICFTDLFYKPLQGKDMKIHHSALNCSHDADNPDILRWRVKIASMKCQKFLLCHPQLNHFSEKQEQESKHVQCGEDAVLVKVFHRSEESGEPHVQKSRGVLSNALVVSEYAASLIPEVVSIPPEACQKIHNFIMNPVEANLETLSDYYQPISHSTSPKGLVLKKIASKFVQSPVILYDVQKSLKTSVVKVWLGRSLRQPIMCPSLQLIEVAPEVSICVEHNQNPAECFSDTNLHQASRPKYLSIQDYINVWEKVLLAEAATGSVEDCSLILIKDVILKWPQLKIPTNCTDEIYYIPNGNVTMEVPLEFQNTMEYIELEEGSLLCVRYSLPKLRAVYHMVVNKVEKHEQSDDGEKPSKFSMKPISTEGCRVSRKMHKVMTQNPPCDIQIINLQPSFHRVYQNLLRLVKQDPASLVRKVALGRIEVNGLNSVFSATSVPQTDNACQLWGTTTELNKLQREAIKYGVKRSFQLIQGPPGTGKSVTGAHLAYTLARLNSRCGTGQCVVYCGPSNKAVDVVHDKLQKANNQKDLGLRLLRLYGRTHERRYFPGPYSSHKDGIPGDLNIEGRCHERFLCDALHQKVRLTSSKIGDMEAEFQQLLQKNLSPSPDALKNYKKLIKMVEIEVMRDHYDIILCTCNETAGWRMSQLSQEKRIAQCIVDESGMSHEPETIAAVCLCNHVVLIGDHKQLQPVIKYSPARENGMSISLFERYAEHFPKGLLITLDTQYRMHEAICQFPSDHFYDGCLKADISLSNRRVPGRSMEQFWPQGLKSPILFCNVIGVEEVFVAKSDKGKVDPHSKCNKQEAEKVLEVVNVLHDRHGVEYKEMAVITPYSAQKSLIHQLKDEKCMETIAKLSATKSAKPDVAGGRPAKPADTKLKELTVVSITESQGDEFGYVILSTVRSQPVDEIRNHDLVQPDRRWLRDHLGFLTDSHEINVGITRAKYGLIIIGNRCLLEYDETWKALIDHYKEKRCIVEGKKFPLNTATW